jgi:uncharacterized protein (TIGR03435 family)
LNAEPGGRLTATNVTLKQLVLSAYDLQEFQLVGGPDWLTKDHFDIEAKAAAGSPGNIFESVKGGGPSLGERLLRALLADRFKLEAHSETRELPLYELAFARTDATPGPQLKRSGRKCEGIDSEGAAGAGSGGEAPPCGIMVVTGRILSGGVTLADLASYLSPITGRSVIDRTGAADRFEFVLKWTPDRIPPALSKKNGSTHWAAIDDDGPSLAAAIREQLGLKLESKNGPVKVLVIDRVSRLIPN